MIKVNLTRSENLEIVGGSSVELEIEDYVRGVVSSEIGNTLIEACKAQAVASRTIASLYQESGLSDKSPQAFRISRMYSESYSSCKKAVEETQGEVLCYDGRLLDPCSFSASNGGQTTSSEERWGGYRPYLISQPDPWDAEATNGVKTGHGVGMSQEGAIYAASLGLTYKEILSFYYPGSTLVSDYGKGDVVTMASKVPLYQFLDNVNAIAKSKPDYELGHDGSDGQCDCIGLDIGAIRRSGGKWTGIHGTNYAIRSELENVRTVSSASELSVGEVLLKGRDPGTSGYDLPARYKKGGSNDNGDYRDYYHIGTVTSVKPLRITHMTSPTIKVDTSLGSKWRYAGRLKKVDYTKVSEDDNNNPNVNGGATVMNPISKATVVRCNGYLNLRATEATDSADIGDIPINTVIYIYEKCSTGMWKTIYNGSVGYVNSKYLDEMPLNDNDILTTGLFIPMSSDLATKVLEALKEAKVIKD